MHVGLRVSSFFPSCRLFVAGESRTALGLLLTSQFYASFGCSFLRILQSGSNSLFSLQRTILDKPSMRWDPRGTANCCCCFLVLWPNLGKIHSVCELVVQWDHAEGLASRSCLCLFASWLVKQMRKLVTKAIILCCRLGFTCWLRQIRTYWWTWAGVKRVHINIYLQTK